MDIICLFHFSKICERALDLIPQYHEYPLVQLIINKLQGHAYSAVEGIECNTVSELMRRLKKIFGSNKSVDQYRGELANIFIKPNENIFNYIARVQELRTAIIDKETSTSGYIKETVKDNIEQSVLNSFVNELNLRNFLSLLTKDNNLLQGVNELRSGDCSIFCLVTIPRVRPHKYLDLTRAEALVFITFSMINDVVITMSKRGTDSLNVSFTADAYSKLANLGLVIDNLKIHKRAIIYAFKVCISNIKRKDSAPIHVVKFMEDLLIASKDIVKNPDSYKTEDPAIQEELVLDSIQVLQAKEGISQQRR